jgi:hypothetical protein
MAVAAASEHKPTVEVRVKSLVTGERTTFSMSVDATVDQAWEQAYTELDEAKREGDTFQCAAPEEGKSLMGDLGLTLQQAREQRVCGSEACHYEIKGPSGGAGGGVAV